MLRATRQAISSCCFPKSELRKDHVESLQKHSVHDKREQAYAGVSSHNGSVVTSPSTPGLPTPTPGSTKHTGFHGITAGMQDSDVSFSNPDTPSNTTPKGFRPLASEATKKDDPMHLNMNVSESTGLGTLLESTNDFRAPPFFSQLASPRSPSTTPPKHHTSSSAVGAQWRYDRSSKPTSTQSKSPFSSMNVTESGIFEQTMNSIINEFADTDTGYDMPRVEPQFPWLEDWATEEEKLKGSKLSNRPPPEDRTPKQRNGGNILQARLEGAKAPYSPSSSLRQSDDELVEQAYKELAISSPNGNGRQKQFPEKASLEHSQQALYAGPEASPSPQLNPKKQLFGNGEEQDRAAEVAVPDAGDPSDEWQVSEEQKAAFAARIGLDPNRDFGVIWILEAAFSAPLPDDWERLVNNKGEVVYKHEESTIEMYTHPQEAYYRGVVEMYKAKQSKPKAAPSSKPAAPAQDLEKALVVPRTSGKESNVPVEEKLQQKETVQGASRQQGARGLDPKTGRPLSRGIPTSIPKTNSASSFRSQRADNPVGYHRAPSAGLLLRNLQGVALDSGTPGPDPSDLANRSEDPTPKPPTSGKSKAWGRPRRTRPAGEGAADADEEESLGMDSRPTTAGTVHFAPHPAQSQLQVDYPPASAHQQRYDRQVQPSRMGTGNMDPGTMMYGTGSRPSTSGSVGVGHLNMRSNLPSRVGSTRDPQQTEVYAPEGFAGLFGGGEPYSPQTHSPYQQAAQGSMPGTTPQAAFPSRPPSSGVAPGVDLRAWDPSSNPARSVSGPATSPSQTRSLALRHDSRSPLSGGGFPSGAQGLPGARPSHPSAGGRPGSNLNNGTPGIPGADFGFSPPAMGLPPTPAFKPAVRRPATRQYRTGGSAASSRPGTSGSAFGGFPGEMDAHQAAMQQEQAAATLQHTINLLSGAISSLTEISPNKNAEHFSPNSAHTRLTNGTEMSPPGTFPRDPDRLGEDEDAVLF